jgi:hypothetical protein
MARLPRLRTCRSMPRSTASRAQAELMMPVPPMKRTLRPLIHRSLGVHVPSRRARRRHPRATRHIGRLLRARRGGRSAVPAGRRAPRWCVLRHHHVDRVPLDLEDAGGVVTISPSRFTGSAGSVTSAPDEW